MSILGLFGGDEDEDEAEQAAAEERRRAEEEREREEEAERRAQENAERQRAREEAEAERQRAEAERQRQIDSNIAAASEPSGGVGMRGERTGSGETDDLGRLGAPVEAEAPPSFSMAIGEPETTAYVPEDEIEVTPFGDDAPAPAPQLSPMDRMADVAIAQGSQQSMADQGYEAPPDDNAQRQALAQIAGAEARTAETPDALAAPNPEPAPPQPGGPQATGVTSMGKPTMAPTPPPEEQPDPDLLQLQQAADRTQQRGDEREDELARAQRRDRILKAIRGLLKVGGAVGGATAIMRGNPIGALAGAGIARGGDAVFGSLGGYGQDTALRQRGARADEQTAAQQRAAAMRAGQYGRQLGQTEEAQRQRSAIAKQQRADSLAAVERAAAERARTAPLEEEEARAGIRRTQLQNEQGALEIEQARAMNDPESPTSRRLQDEILANAGMLRGMNIDPDRIRQMPASQLEALRAAYLRRASVRRGGGGGGGGSRQARADAYRQIPTSELRLYRSQYPNESDADHQARWLTLPLDERIKREGDVNARGALGEQEDREQARLGSEWEYAGEGAPPDGSVTLARDGYRGMRRLRRAVADMERAYEAADPADIASSESPVRSLWTRRARDYFNAKDEAEQAVRYIKEMGSLVGGEREELRVFVPSMVELGVAGDTYPLTSLVSTVDGTFEALMDALRFRRTSGESRGGGQSQGGGSGGGDTVTVQTPDGGTREITREQYERLMERRRAQQ